ncbi:MAG: glycosyltransferase family 4 protein [Proteobacteria bacterium]|nr:glycosyltransferase family 4 protein [Pseudomonadota bacterium]
MESRLAITWGLSRIHGWGVFGINLVRGLLLHRRGGWPRPMLLQTTPEEFLTTDDLGLFRPLIDEREKIVAETAAMPAATLGDVCVIHSSGNRLTHGEVSRRFRGSRNIGFTFFENSDIPDASLALVRGFDGMMTGSNWNRDRLIELGLADVSCVHQGVDTDLFQPQKSANKFSGRFVIFSGGKLEFRKGQDIAVAVFRAFHARHPDALLLTVWQNPWYANIASLKESKHLRHDPPLGHESKAMTDWTAAEGIPAGAHIDLGAVNNQLMPEIYREAHAALFTNRCEGGTNLVAMEAMASGVPTVLSANTGHLDLIHDDNCLPLTRQTPVNDPDDTRRGWGESDVEETLEKLEAIYADRQAAKKIGLNGARRMFKMSWPGQIAKLIETVSAGT